MDRRPGPTLGDYTGLPINDAARFRADAYDASLWSLPEWQCRPHAADWMPFGNSELNIEKEVDPITRQLVAYKMHWRRGALPRYIWMDGRPHPSKYAPRTWEGFSTGRWEGETLVITVSHLLEFYHRRNGISRSPDAEITQLVFMDDDHLTWSTIAYDPAYLTEPLIRNASYRRVPHQQIPASACVTIVEEVRPRDEVPSFMPGGNPYLTEFATMRGLPLEAVRGGAETMYPEYQKKLKELMKAK
jgi:hypothetical protein